jgi:penicillin-binding protein 2
VENVSRDKEGRLLALPGVHLVPSSVRDYPHGNLASHLVGFVGEVARKEIQENHDARYRAGDPIGKWGTEKTFEKELKGKDGQALMLDIAGLEPHRVQVQKLVPGKDLHLTIDLELQRAAEDAMGDKAGAVVVMEVNSGNLLAMSSTPHLPLEEFAGGISASVWERLIKDPLHPLLNKAIQGQYPPGSTFKIVTALAALSEGVISPDATFLCNGLDIDNRRYSCQKKDGHGSVDLHRALTESCDVYFYSVGQRLGIDTIARYADLLGLGRKTGIALEHEKGGLIPTTVWKQQRFKEEWREGETLSAAIGQGYVLTTPLQICRLTAAVANGGTLYTPRLARRIAASEGKPVVKTFVPTNDGRIPVSTKALALIRKAMIETTSSPGGNAKAALLPADTMGGMAGTTQVVHLALVNGKNEKNLPYSYRDHSWFTSFAPAEQPEIAVTVLVEHGGGGGLVAEAIARDVLKRFFELKNEPRKKETLP